MLHSTIQDWYSSSEIDTVKSRLYHSIHVGYQFKSGQMMIRSGRDYYVYMSASVISNDLNQHTRSCFFFFFGKKMLGRRRRHKPTKLVGWCKKYNFPSKIPLQVKISNKKHSEGDGSNLNFGIVTPSGSEGQGMHTCTPLHHSMIHCQPPFQVCDKNIWA